MVREERGERKKEGLFKIEVEQRVAIHLILESGGCLEVVQTLPIVFHPSRRIEEF